MFKKAAIIAQTVIRLSLSLAFPVATAIGILSQTKITPKLTENIVPGSQFLLKAHG